MDDLGYGDLSCYHVTASDAERDQRGNQDSGISTPNIDGIASDGVRFTQFYSPSNICSPARRALLTGRYQSRLGEWAEAYRGTPTFDAVSGTEEPCFAQYLKKSGYTSGSFGKWNIGEVHGVSTPEAHGFDYWIGSFHNHSYFGHRRDQGVHDFWENGEPAHQYDGQFSDDVFIDKAIEFIHSVGTNNTRRTADRPQKFGTRNTELGTRGEQRIAPQNPFFVYLPLCTPHEPFQDPADPVEGPQFDWWNKETGGDKNCVPVDQKRPNYIKMVEHVDKRIGDLLNTVSELGLEENTIVMFSSDNGGTPTSINSPLRGCKQGMLDGGIRVPTIVKWPGVYPAGTVSHQVGILMDFSRTILEAGEAMEYAGPERELDGIDLTPIFSGKAPEAKRELGWRRREWDVGERNYNNVWAEAYIKGDWKYIREFKETPGFARAAENGHPDTGYLELLFHLKDDIHEDCDLSKKEPGKLCELRNAFEEWKEQTVDPDNHYKIPTADQYSVAKKT